MVLMNADDWDEAFANAAYIQHSATYPDRWRRSAKAFSDTHRRIDSNLPYGPHPRQKYDLFWPSTQTKGLVVFVHGGYWLAFDKSYWSHLAEGACSQGWAVAIPSYVLTPEVRVSKITQMIAKAIEHVSKQVDGPIVLAGHSAGGHLVARTVCEHSPIQEGTRVRICRIVSISGLHDLRNLIHTQMNKQLQLSEDEASAESPVLQNPIASARVICWVGSEERPEFLRQATSLRDAWKNLVADIQLVVEPNRHHFNVIESLTDSNSPLTLRLVGAQ